jgi:uncharacterized protein YlxW (UPF0749 family)
MTASNAAPRQTPGWTVLITQSLVILLLIGYVWKSDHDTNHKIDTKSAHRTQQLSDQNVKIQHALDTANQAISELRSLSQSVDERTARQTTVLCQAVIQGLETAKAAHALPPTSATTIALARRYGCTIPNDL